MKKKTEQKQSSTYNNNNTFGWYTPEDTDDIKALRGWQPGRDPSIGYAFGSAKNQIANSFNNPMGGNYSPQMRDAILRSSLSDLGQQEAAAHSQDRYQQNQLDLQRKQFLAGATGRKLVQTGGSGTSSGTSTTTESGGWGEALLGGAIQAGLGFATGGMSLPFMAAKGIPKPVAPPSIQTNSPGILAPVRYFGRGGNLSRALKRPGDKAVVGEYGPEVAVLDKDRDVQIIPNLDGLRELGQRRALAAMMARQDPSRQDLGLPPDAVELPKVQAPGGIDESYMGYDGGDAVRPRSVEPQITGNVQSPPALRPRRFSVPTLASDTFPGEGVPSPLGEATTRRRVARPVEFLENRVLEDLTTPPRVPEGGIRGRLLGMVRGAARGAQLGGPGGAIVGATAYGLDPSLASRDDAEQLLGEDIRRLGQARAVEAARLKADEARADIGWKEARPDLERDKLLARERHLRQQEALRLLGTLKGQNVDPTNPAHARIIQQLEDAGVPFDPVAFNDSASNLAGFDLIDPENPTRKRKVYYNKATGQFDEVGASGYVQPVDSATGMTPYQSNSLALGGARFGETQRHNQVTEGQGAERIGIARQNLQLSAERNLISWKSYEQRRDNVDFREKRTHYNEARKLIEQHNKYRAAAERYAGYRDERGQQPQWARLKQQEQEALAGSTRGELENVYGDVYQEGGGQGLAAPPQPSATAPTQAPAPRGRVSRANFGKFREQNPQYAQMDDGQVEQLLRSQGIEVY